MEETSVSLKVGLSDKDKQNMANDVYNRADAKITPQLNAMHETIQSLGGLQPSGVDSASNILSYTENKGVYVANDTGGWYYWNGSTYVYGGMYQNDINAIDLGTITISSTSYDLAIAIIVGKIKTYVETNSASGRNLIFTCKVNYSSTNLGSWLMIYNGETQETYVNIYNGSENVIYRAYYNASNVVVNEKVTQKNIEIADGSITTEKLSENINNILNNLMNVPYTLIDGSYINASKNGVLGNASGYSYTDYIELKNVKSIVFPIFYDYQAGVAFYDSNKKFLYGLTNPSNELGELHKEDITNENVAYVRLTCKTNNKDNFFIKISNLYLTFKNIYDKEEEFLNQFIISNNINFTEGTYYQFNGTLGKVDSNNYVSSNKILISKSLIGMTLEIYTYLAGNTYIWFFDEEDKPLLRYPTEEHTSDLTETLHIITIPQKAYSIGISNRLDKLSTPYIKLKSISIEKVDKELVIEKNGGACRIFHDWGFIGDSLSSGQLEYTKADGSTGFYNNYVYSFGQCIARAMGVSATNYSTGGLTAKSINESTSSNITALWSSNKQVYCIALGTNDKDKINTLYANGWGNENDIDLSNYNNNGDSFVGWYAKIIQRIREINEDCYFFLLTNPMGKNEEQLNAITLIANKFNKCYVINTDNYSTKWTAKYKMGGHLSPYGYQIYGDYVMSLISKLILEDESKFKNVGFIGTEYKNKNYE